MVGPRHAIASVNAMRLSAFDLDDSRRSEAPLAAHRKKANHSATDPTGSVAVEWRNIA